MVYTPTTWQDNVTVVNAVRMNNIENELVYLDPRIPPAALTYGTTLPGSPVDGQEAILVDSTTNPSYQWRFRYNAGSAGANKWEFIGGASALVAFGGDEALSAAGAWCDPVTTIGPQFTVPRAGDYRVQHRERVYNSTSNVAVQSGLTIGAGLPGNYADGNPSVPSNTQYNLWDDLLYSGLTAGQTLRVRYLTPTATGHVTNRLMWVTPVRVF